MSLNRWPLTALGDVAGRALLTPVAIAAARRLSNRLFGGDKYKNEKLSYEDIPTVVFSCVPSPASSPAFAHASLR